MATLVTRISDLATRISTEVKALRTLLNGNAADLSSLTTTAKNNLVASINELKAGLDAAILAGGAQINDSLTSSTTHTWSVTKISTELTDLAADIKAEILGGAGAAYDTLQELKDLLDSEAGEIDSLLTAVGNRVRFDTAAQGLTGTEKQNARTNIGADITSAEIGNPDTDFVTIFTTGLS